MVLEAGPDIGGVWLQNYVGYGLQVPWHSYQFPEFPWPKELQPSEEYPNGHQVQRYIRAYAERYDLLRLVRYNCKVLRLRWHPGRRVWEALYADSEHNKFYRVKMDYVAVCSGMYCNPSVPRYPGADIFTGPQLHARDFTDNTIVKGRRVLIVGAGKTALDCSLVASRTASSITMLYRQAHWPVPRAVLGVQTYKLLFNRATPAMLPPYYAAGRTERTVHSFTRPLKRLFWKGIEGVVSLKFHMKKDHRPHVNLPEDLFYGGQILEDAHCELLESDGFTRIWGEVNSFVRNGVILQDGSFLAADVVLYCTGYEKKYEVFDGETRSKLGLQKDGLYLYRNCLPCEVPHLAFVGSEVHTYSNILTYGLQALWLAHVLSRRIKLPSPADMAEDVRAQQHWRRTVMPPQRNRGAVLLLYGMQYHDQLLRDMGIQEKRKGRNLLAECFGAYSPEDYTSIMGCAGAAADAGAQAATTDSPRRMWKSFQSTVAPESEDAETHTAKSGASGFGKSASRLSIPSATSRATSVRRDSLAEPALSPSSVDVGSGPRSAFGDWCSDADPQASPAGARSAAPSRRISEAQDAAAVRRKSLAAGSEDELGQHRNPSVCPSGGSGGSTCQARPSGSLSTSGAASEPGAATGSLGAPSPRLHHSHSHHHHHGHHHHHHHRHHHHHNHHNHHHDQPSHSGTMASVDGPADSPGAPGTDPTDELTRSATAASLMLRQRSSRIQRRSSIESSHTATSSPHVSSHGGTEGGAAPRVDGSGDGSANSGCAGGSFKRASVVPCGSGYTNPPQRATLTPNTRLPPSRFACTATIAEDAAGADPNRYAVTEPGEVSGSGGAPAPVGGNNTRRPSGRAWTDAGMVGGGSEAQPRKGSGGSLPSTQSSGDLAASCNGMSRAGWQPVTPAAAEYLRILPNASVPAAAVGFAVDAVATIAPAAAAASPFSTGEYDSGDGAVGATPRRQALGNKVFGLGQVPEGRELLPGSPLGVDAMVPRVYKAAGMPRSRSEAVLPSHGKDDDAASAALVGFLPGTKALAAAASQAGACDAVPPTGDPLPQWTALVRTAANARRSSVGVCATPEGGHRQYKSSNAVSDTGMRVRTVKLHA